MSKLSEWAAREPVRLYVYTVISVILACLVAYGIVDEQIEAIALAAAAALLAVPTVEKARSKVTPWSPDEERF